MSKLPHFRGYIEFSTTGWLEIECAWSPKFLNRISGDGIIAEGIVGCIIENFSGNGDRQFIRRLGRLQTFRLRAIGACPMHCIALELIVDGETASRCLIWTLRCVSSVSLCVWPIGAEIIKRKIHFAWK